MKVSIEAKHTLDGYNMKTKVVGKKGTVESMKVAEV